MPEPSSPPRPNLENRKKQAKTLLKALRAGDLSAAERCRRHLPRVHRYTLSKILQQGVTLQEAQRVLARDYGSHDWTAMVHALTCGSALGIFERLSDSELQWMADHAEVDELAKALRAVSASVRERLCAVFSEPRWASVEARMGQLGPVRLSDVERIQMDIVQRLPGENPFV